MLLIGMTACNQDNGNPESEAPSVNIPAGENIEPADEQPADQPPSSEPDVPSDITPLMWLVTSPDGQTMYLFGSIHAGMADIYPLPDSIMDAFLQADYLAVEADILAFSADEAAVGAYAAALMYEDGRTIYDDLDQELIDLAKEKIAEALGMPVMFLSALDDFKPFEWYNTLTMLSVELSDISFDYGLDSFFLIKAYERGMEILEIESLDFQFGMFLGFSNELLEILIAGMLDLELAAEEINSLFDAWKAGDEELIISLVKPVYDDLFYEENIEHFEDYEDFLFFVEIMREFNDAMLTQRDIGMAEAAKQYLADGKNVFYVVGVAHLVGENSVVDLLRQSGYTVEVVEIN
jgi:hypothetical protein